MTIIESLQAIAVVTGAVFCLIGTVGLLRFPDIYTRIHAITKVDNLGLGLVVLGLLPSAPSVSMAIKVILIWLLALAASATIGHLMARSAYTAAGNVSVNKSDGEP